MVQINNNLDSRERQIYPRGFLACRYQFRFPGLDRAQGSLVKIPGRAERPEFEPEFYQYVSHRNVLRSVDVVSVLTGKCNDKKMLSYLSVTIY